MKLQPLQHAWTQTVQKNKRLNLETKPSFILYHNPQNWQLVKFPTKGKKKDKYLLLPELSTLVCVAGVNMVQEIGGRLDTTFAKANLMKNGYTIIEPEQHNYLCSYPVKHGTRYDLIFNEYEQIGTTVIETFDHAAYNEFKRELVANGVIDIPHQHFIKLLIHETRPLIDKYANLLHTPTGQQKYEDALQRVQILEEQIELLKTKGKDLYYGQRKTEQQAN